MAENSQKLNQEKIERFKKSMIKYSTTPTPENIPNLLETINELNVVLRSSKYVPYSCGPSYEVFIKVLKCLSQQLVSKNTKCKTIEKEYAELLAKHEQFKEESQKKLDMAYENINLVVKMGNRVLESNNNN